MKAKLIKLLQYVASNITVVKSTKGNGMNCYKLEQIATHKEAIETLASACDWQLRYFESKYNEKTKSMSTPLYYIGPKVSNELDKDDIMDFVNK